LLLRSVSHSYLPMLDWIQGYRKEWLRADVVAGLTTAAVVIPKGHGLRNYRRTTGAGGTLYGIPADADLLSAGDFHNR
jgi:MFS superfamily sulfate permease-like transporter